MRLLNDWQETVELQMLSPQARLLKHSDGNNARLNLHMTLLGGAGAWLRVGEDTIRFGMDGAIRIFDISYDHEAGNDGSEDRWILNLGLAHPDFVTQYAV